MDDFDIGIATEGQWLAPVADDFSAELRGFGLNVRAENRPGSELRAGLEWVMPTAVVLFLANRYLGTLLEEAAKDHYPLLKAAFRRLVRRTTGRTREASFTVLSSSASKVSERDPATLSVWAPLRGARRAVFRFDHALSPEALEVAVEQLFELLLAYARENDGSHLLDRAPTLVSEASSWAPVVLRFDPDHKAWRVWVLDQKGVAARWDA